MDTKAKIEARKRTLLRGIERALLAALSDSSEMHRSLFALQRAGYTLRLSVDCYESSRLGRDTVSVAAPAAEGFRIDSADLRFLHSIGIDPTRRQRQRSGR